MATVIINCKIGVKLPYIVKINITQESSPQVLHLLNYGLQLLSNESHLLNNGLHLLNNGLHMLN